MASIQYADLLNIERLPIDAQDVVTRVTLVIAGNKAGADPRIYFAAQDDGSGSWGDAMDKTPLPIVYEYADAAHSTYGSERAFALPEGIDPFLSPEHEDVPEPSIVTGFTNPGDPSAIRDGDPSTKATVSGSGLLSYVSVQGGWGFRIRYEATRSGGDALQLVIRNQRGVSVQQGFITYAHFDLNSNEPTDEYFVMPADARNETVNTGSLSGNSYRANISLHAFTGTTASVFHFYPLILNEALLLDIAKQQIRLPAETPQRVTVRGYVAPDKEHTIVGWPGGDYTGVVAQVQYELGRTVIDFEQAGAPVGLPAEALEAARERRVAIDRAVSEASYPVRMGERQ